MERMRRPIIFGAIALVVVLAAVAATLAATGQWKRLRFRPLPIDWITVPAGEFTMGSTDEQLALADEMCSSCDLTSEQPAHQVFLDAYQIGKVEVTNRQYAQCVRAGVCRPPSASRYLEEEFASHPVVYVNWVDADTFCRWTDERGRLPSEAEWEKAARGADGRIFPWGNQAPDCSRANYGGRDAGCVGDAAPVGSYPDGASPYGVFDLAGNVAEWVADWFQQDYYADSPARNPHGPEQGVFRVLRGGSWVDGDSFLRSALRNEGEPGGGGHQLGFRCARSP